jgi:hypothetical protein
MGFNALFFGETGYPGRSEPRLLMLNIREFFPAGPRFHVSPFAGMIIDSKSPPAGWAGQGFEDRERGGWT